MKHTQVDLRGQRNSVCVCVCVWIEREGNACSFPRQRMTLVSTTQTQTRRKTDINILHQQLHLHGSAGTSLPHWITTLAGM